MWKPQQEQRNGTKQAQSTLLPKYLLKYQEKKKDARKMIKETKWGRIQQYTKWHMQRKTNLEQNKTRTSKLTIKHVNYQNTRQNKHIHTRNILADTYADINNAKIYDSESLHLKAKFETDKAHIINYESNIELNQELILQELYNA